jgi:hypothetical protein
MKKVILFIAILSVLGTFFGTYASAEPEITEVKGGWGVVATVVNASGLSWEIKTVLLYHDSFPPGGDDYYIDSGVVSGNGSVVIRTTMFPPMIYLGVVKITVTLSGDIQLFVQRSQGFMIGPFVLFVHEVTAS